jgi:hypothetical protein
MSKKYANPLGLDGIDPAERERLSDENEKLLAVAHHGTAQASLPLPGPMRNPGFAVTPWVARPEIEGNIGKWCPKHLHVFTEDEMQDKHYPYAVRNADGVLTKFCWACGRPCREDGLSGMGHKGSGKPCSACGFRRKRKLTEGQLAGLRKGQALLAQAHAEGHTGPAAWEHVKAIAPKNGPAAEKQEQRMVRSGQRAKALTELMRMRADARAETIMAPYFEALDLKPREDWSPSTKLEFYSNQTSIAEKLLNRLEGLPVARTRNVDVNDEDVIPEGELSPTVVAKLISAIIAGGDVEELIIDAEVEEVEAA